MTTSTKALVLPEREWELRCWGSLALKPREQTGLREFAPRGRKTRALLAYLALHQGTPIPRDRIASLLWGRSGTGQARGSLRQALRELKSIPVSAGLRTDRESICLDRAVIATDMELISQVASSDRFEELAARLSEAAPILLDDLSEVSEEFDEWLRSERTAAELQRTELAAAAAERALMQGNLEAAAAIACELERFAPADERAGRIAMRIEAKRNGIAAAERRFQRLADRLRYDLDVGPSPETLELRRSLIGQPPGPTRSQRDEIAAERAENLDRGDSHRPNVRFGPRLKMLLVMLTLAAGTAALVLLAGYRDTKLPTIAVLPFQSAAPDDRYFALGVADEIAAQLSQEPGLRLIGRSSTLLLSEVDLDSPELGRRLGASHLLEGSVRRLGGRVRVSVALLDGASGVRIWSHDYHGEMLDAFSIQAAIGNDVANKLRRRLGARTTVQKPPRSDAFTLYTTARGLLRTRESRNIRMAVDLLRQAVELDPEFASAWASLGAAQWIGRGFLEETSAARALANVRRSLALNPDLARGHATLGMILEGDPSALGHLERAAALAPSDSEILHWLGNARMQQGDVEGALRAARRAAELDPFWIRSSAFGELAWSLGLQTEAERFETRLANDHPDPAARLLARARLASRRGDWSAFVLLCERAARQEGGELREAAHIQAIYGRLLLDLPYQQVIFTPVIDAWDEVMRGRIADLSALPGMRSDPTLFWRLPDIAAVQSRLLIEQGRGAELLTLYDRAFAAPEEMAAQDFGHGFLYHAPSVAIALRQAGRVEESIHMLRIAEQRALSAAAKVRIPLDTRVLIAGVLATLGQTDEALNHLRIARSAGWPNGARRSPWVPRTMLLREPAFQSMRQHPALRRMDAEIQLHLQREREELRRAERS